MFLEASPEDSLEGSRADSLEGKEDLVDDGLESGFDGVLQETSFKDPSSVFDETVQTSLYSSKEDPRKMPDSVEQERLMSRLERVDVQLDALDDKRVECYGGEKARKPVRKIPEQTVVYDMKRGVATIETLAEYYRKNGRPKMPTYTTVYDPSTQSAKLLFWKQYVEGGFEAADLEARKPKPPKPLPELTVVYDKDTKEAKLMKLEEYRRMHKMPKQDYAAVYDPASKSVKLIFWKTYLEQYLAADLAARKKPIPHYTTVYNKETQSVDLITWDKYLRTHKAPPCQAYAALYDEKTQGIKLVFWKQYVEQYLQQASKSAVKPEYTTVYDPSTQEAKLVTWDTYLKTHKAPPVGHYTTVYDQQSQSCKLVTWRDYLEHHQGKQHYVPPKPAHAAGVAAAAAAAPKKGATVAPKKSAPEYTAVYDEKTKSVKLQLWDEYIKSNRPTWTQSYAAVYDRDTQSVKTVFWRQYKEEYLKKDLEARKARIPRLPEQTVVYDPKTQTAKLQLWSDYIKENKPSWRQDYAAIYDSEMKSVKLIYWKHYVELYEPYDIKAREARKKKESQKGS